MRFSTSAPIIALAALAASYGFQLPGKVMLADVLTKAVERQRFLTLLCLFNAYAADGIVCPS